MRWGRGRLVAVWTLTLACLLAMAPASRAQEPVPVQGVDERVPLLAYYYIRYDPSSWERAKTDYPLLGPYSSDDEEVMAQHAQWAKTAGIDGLIVSWKSTQTMDPRLEQLVQASEAAGLKLAIIYQGLDFLRRPRPIERVAADLSAFADRYTRHPVFDLFGRPLVIWNGTPEYSQEEVAQVTKALRDRLLILASEREVQGYTRVADLVEGNAYYWSSVDPNTNPGYPERLATMGRVVHEHGGLWIAPAAPGYDATIIGGEEVVERRDGETLRRELAAAMQSSPDAIGLISWNEFSENTYIEPSRRYGVRFLEVLAEWTGGTAPSLPPDWTDSMAVEVQTVPALSGIHFALNGRPFSSDEHGRGRLEVERPGPYHLEVVPVQEWEGYRAQFKRWRINLFAPARWVQVPAAAALQTGFEVSYRVAMSYVDTWGRPVSADRVTSVTLKSSDGLHRTLDTAQPQWLQANRLVLRMHGLEAVEVAYTVESVVVDGVNAVNHGEQRFWPSREQDWKIELLLYSARFAVRDALFRFATGSAIHLEHPNGQVTRLALDANGQTSVDSLVRGLYRVTAEGAPGVALTTPVALSKDQEMTLSVISYLDIAVVLLLAVFLAIIPLLLGRPALWLAVRARLAQALRIFAVALLVTMAAMTSASGVRCAEPPMPVPAYYYIWFDPGLWDRAKSDWPVLGRYSSDDRDAMRQQVQWAKHAGIEGFIVSWNEFSENTHVEPSQNHGMRHAAIAAPIDFASDEPGEIQAGPAGLRLASPAFLAAIILVSTAVIARRQSDGA